jgi:TolA-binding protein
MQMISNNDNKHVGSNQVARSNGKDSNRANKKNNLKKLKNFGSKDIEQLRSQLQSLKTKFNLSSPNIAIDQLQNNKSFSEEVDRFDTQSTGRHKLAALERAVGEKFMPS